MSTPRQIRSQQAFTLVELLVVMAIIGVLLAMLLPSLGKAKAEAAKSVCMNLQRQAIIALNAYATDAHEYPCIISWDPAWTWIGSYTYSWVNVGQGTNARSVSYIDSAAGGGLPAWALVVNGGYLADYKFTHCTAPFPALGSNVLMASSNWNGSATSVNYYSFCGPDYRADPSSLDDCGSGFIGRNNLAFNFVIWGNSGAGWTYKDSRQPSSFSITSCPGFGVMPIYGVWGTGYEPHGSQPMGTRNYNTWNWTLASERAIGYADGHVFYLRF